MIVVNSLDRAGPNQIQTGARRKFYENHANSVFHREITRIIEYLGRRTLLVFAISKLLCTVRGHAYVNKVNIFCLNIIDIYYSPMYVCSTINAQPRTMLVGGLGKAPLRHVIGLRDLNFIECV